VEVGRSLLLFLFFFLSFSLSNKCIPVTIVTDMGNGGYSKQTFGSLQQQQMSDAVGNILPDARFRWATCSSLPQ
jgi:hypothetical protein